MHSSAQTADPASPPAPSSIRSLQLAELARAAAKYGFDAIPNELPHRHEPDPAEEVLRRHLSHLRLSGSVLDPSYRPRPRLSEVVALDGVPLRVDILDRYAPLERCILCGGSKGETYTICAGCYTTQMRFAERTLLQILPDLDEETLSSQKTLSPDQFVRAVRRTPRLEPKRRGRLLPEMEAVRRTARRAVALAERAARLDALRSACAEEAITPAERRRRDRRLRAAEAAQPWEVREWARGRAASPLHDVWLALLAAGDAAPDAGEPDDDYPVEWLEGDWMAAPDRVAFMDEIAAPFLPRANLSAGGPEHVVALERNALFDAWRAARAQARYEDDGPDPYFDWLTDELKARGGIPAEGRARTSREWDEDECERWDRWVDAILGGEPAAPPEGLDPFDVFRCRLWGEAVTTDDEDVRAPIHLPRLDRGLPSGRLRWPHFIREEIEAEVQPWGRWVEIAEEDGGTVRVWTDDDTRPTRRRLRRAAVAALLQRRLDHWAAEGARRQQPRTRSLIPRPKGSYAAWEREIRAERRRRRFERLARASAGMHPTHLEKARHQSH